MAKLTLTDISSGYLAPSVVNANNAATETAMEKTLSRDGTTPNQMEAQLDMNSNRVINLPTPVENTDAASKQYVDSLLDGTTDTGSAQLRADLADGTDTDNGDALISGKRSLTGAVAFTIHQFNENRTANLKTDFGAQGDGVANDYGAMLAAINSGAKNIFIPEGTYIKSTGTTLNIPAGQVWQGASRRDTKIVKGANGDMFSMGEGSGFLDIYLDGAGASFTGRILVFAGSAGKQFAHRVTTIDAEDFCLEFETEAGSQSCFVDCLIARYSGTTSDAFCSVGIEDVQQLAAKPRKFIGCETNGTYFVDFGGSNNTYVIGCFSGGFKFSDESRGVFINSTRWANQASCTVRGHQIVIQGGDILPDLTLTGSGPIIVGPGAFTGTVTDSGSAGQNMVYMEEVAYTPTWTQPTGTPVIGDGTLTGSYSRDGDIVHANINFAVGAGTTFGTGEFRFSVPIVTTSARVQIGQARLIDTGTTLAVGVAVLTAAGSYVTMNTEASLTAVGTAAPWTWATGDVIQISIDYTV